jgi:hypothetical protein
MGRGEGLGAREGGGDEDDARLLALEIVDGADADGGEAPGGRGWFISVGFGWR